MADKKLRVEQWKSESADLFAMRAYAKAMPQMSDNELVAAARWIWSISEQVWRDRKAAKEQERVAAEQNQSQQEGK